MSGPNVTVRVGREVVSLDDLDHHAHVVIHAPSANSTEKGMAVVILALIDLIRAEPTSESEQ